MKLYIDDNEINEINLNEPFITNEYEYSHKEFDKNSAILSAILSNDDINPNYKISKGIGHFYNLLSLIAFFLTNIFTKVEYLYSPDLTAELSNLYRSATIMILAIFHIIISWKNLNFTENTNNKQILFLNSLFGNLIYIFYFLACFYLRLGTAYTLLNSYTLFCFILAYFILKEQIIILDFVGLIIGFLSIIMILHFGRIEVPFDSPDPELLNVDNSTVLTTVLGIIFGILGSLSKAAKIVALKQGANVNINLHFLMFWMGLAGIIISFMGIIVTNQDFLIDIPIIVISLILGFTTFYGNWFMIECFKHITMIESLIPGFLTIILSFIAGKYMFNNSIDWMDIVGSVILITFSYFYIRHKVLHDDY